MKKQLVKGIIIRGTGIVLALALVACSNWENFSLSSKSSSQSLGIDYHRFAAATTVCSPLNGAGPTTDPSIQITYLNGLSGRLFSLNPGAPIPQNLAQQFQYSSDVGINLFLNDLNVPTRLFTEGFPNAQGQLLTNAAGTELVEYFGMQLQSAIQLTFNDVPGAYQFAVISDDGSTFSLDPMSNNNFTTLIDDDGTHPSLMKCANSPISLSRGQQIPMKLQYFQGPRYHIALMLMWRPWPAKSADVQDPLCGSEGNNQFFDPNTVPSTPTQNYQDLLARGWKPLVPGNYIIPDLSFNPCNVPNYFGAQ